jgi:hypothetical protein
MTSATRLINLLLHGVTTASARADLDLRAEAGTP